VRVMAELPKIHTAGEDRVTRLEVYVADGDGDIACKIGWDEFETGMGLSVGVWTTLAGLERLRDALNAVLVQS
jgi:hypothetical protein